MATMANRSAATQSGDADEEDFEDSKDMAINITFDLIHNKDSRDGCTSKKTLPSIAPDSNPIPKRVELIVLSKAKPAEGKFSPLHSWVN